MEREVIVQRLTAHRDMLADFKVKSLAIFGSVARGEAKTGSDIDFLVEFEGAATFDQYMKLKHFLEDLLGTSVDLITRKGIRREILPYVEQEAVYVP